MKKDGFQDCEQKGRVLFTKAFLENNPKIKEYKFTKGKYDKYDLEMIDVNNIKWIVEIKYRSLVSSTAPMIQNEGVMLEKMKLGNIMKENGRHLYVYGLNDGVWYLYDLDNLDFSKIRLEKKKCPVAGCDKSRGYMYKDVYFLHPSLSKAINQHIAI